MRANKVCTARRAKRNDIALMAPKKPSSTQNATLQSMGMDVIKQYPGPLSLTVSRAVKLAVKLPGKQAQALPAAHRRGARNASYPGTAVEFTVKYGNVSAPSAAPSSNSPSSSDALPLRLRHPRARPGRRPTLRRPAP